MDGKVEQPHNEWADTTDDIVWYTELFCARRNQTNQKMKEVSESEPKVYDGDHNCKDLPSSSILRVSVTKDCVCLQQTYTINSYFHSRKHADTTNVTTFLCFHLRLM